MTGESQIPSAESLYYQALDLLAAGSAADAVPLLRRSLEADPGMLDSMHALIRALQDSGELDSAITAACRLAELDPEDALAHTSLSILYQRKGMIAEAEAEALKAKLLGWKKEIRAEAEEKKWKENG